MHLDIEQTGAAKHLVVGDRFVFVDGNDKREHVITADQDSHFEYDSRPNKHLSKDTLVKRVGTHDVGERKSRIVSSLEIAIKQLNKSGDISAWMISMSDIVSTAINYGMNETVLQLEKLEKLGTALFSHAKGRREKTAIETLDKRNVKEWNQASASAIESLRNSIMAETSLRSLIRKIVRS
jgi:hypothetical protein